MHVREVGLAAADDSTVWAYARRHGFAIVSKDGDFSSRSVLYGAPPKVIWLAVGNCSTGEIERHLRGHREDMRDLIRSTPSGKQAAPCAPDLARLQEAVTSSGR